jgi:hypothetical protein
MRAEEFLSQAWSRYVRLTPDAAVIHRLLSERGERIINDHVAFRTFDINGIGRLELGRVFEDWGWKRHPEDLDFPEKKLKASYWLPPTADLPKIFISELILSKCSRELAEWVKGFARAPGRAVSASYFLEPSWQPVAYADYERFYGESEYASWTAAFGVQVNHFTVLVNELKTFKSLQELDTFLVSNGLKLNEAGGAIKGTPDEKLEQTSTMARKIPSKFAAGETRDVLGCYYEFARRYPVSAGGALFQGFIPKSADKIFESTFEKKRSQSR